MGERIRLEVIDVAEPCREDWGAMRGDDRVRFCGTCTRHVYDLSAMTRGDAEDLVAESEGRLCVRFYRRVDGTVTTTDCAPDRLAAVRRRAKKSLAFAAVAAAGLMTLVGALGAVTALGVFAEEIVEPEPVPLMGAMPYGRPEWDPPIDESEAETADEQPAESTLGG